MIVAPNQTAKKKMEATIRQAAMEVQQVLLGIAVIKIIRLRMSFFPESERKFNDVKSNQVGPGAYFSDHDALRLRDAYAPFLSTTKRQDISQPSKLVPPGPGQYEISTKIVEPLIQTLSNSHSIIVKINSTGTVPFKSGQQRFDDNYGEVPGPGSYVQPGMGQSRTRRNKCLTVEETTTPNSMALQHIREMNKKRRNPTIPARVTSLSGSKEMQHTRDPRELELQRGPGKYEMPGGFGRGRGALWGRDHVKRFSMNIEPNVGPGKYTPTDGRKPDYKYNPSSTFVSDTVRTHFDSLYFKTNQNFKAKIRMKSNYKAPQPGPGQYDSNVSAIQLKNTPFPFQFFGSTVERFEQDNAEPLGPGVYKLPSQFENRKLLNKAALSFNSSSERDSSFLEFGVNALDHIPGPGAYTEELVKRPKLYGKNRRIQMFGVAEKRFVDNKQIKEKPGPGAYFYQEDLTEEGEGTNTNRDPTNGIFKSSTSRNCFGDDKKDQIPFASYDVNQYDLSSKAEKQKLFIENLKKIDVEKAPFDSSHSRFPHYEPKKQKDVKEKEPMEATTARASGEEFLRQRKSRSVATSPQIVRPAFLIGEKRFADNKKGAPSVGAYELRTQWDKKSFNRKFEMQLQQRSEK